MGKGGCYGSYMRFWAAWVGDVEKALVVRRCTRAVIVLPVNFEAMIYGEIIGLSKDTEISTEVRERLIPTLTATRVRCLTGLTADSRGVEMTNGEC